MGYDHMNGRRAMKREMVYVCGPYTNGDKEKNVKDAIDVADKLFSCGYAPFVPHLTHYWEMLSDEEYSYDDWMELDVNILRHCDQVFVIPGDSKGAREEIRLAKQLGKRVVRLKQLKSGEWTWGI